MITSAVLTDGINVSKLTSGGALTVDASGTLQPVSGSAIGSAVPTSAFYNGISDGTNLRGLLGATNGLNTAGTGIPTAQIVGQFDDVSPISITENQFGNIRMSANRNVYMTIRDANGNERGASVNAVGLVVDASQTTVPVIGSNIASSVPGTGFYMSISDGTSLRGVVNANAGAGTTGTGLLGSGILGYDGTNWQYTGIDSLHNLKVTASTTSAVVNVGQKTVNTTPVQLSGSSTVPTNGIIVKALSTNLASIFVGPSGVTTSTGYELVAGEAISFTCNLNTLYIVSATSTTDKACYNVE